VVWQARQLGIPFTMPPAHPFNPVPALRLALALGCSYDAIRTIFEFIWKEGRSVTAEWPALCVRLGLDDADALIAQAAIKDRLRANGEAALKAGVFGVPTFVVDGQIFWGVDSTPMLFEYLKNPRLFDDAEMRRASALPVAVHRQS
jgi:2-hydroxychromene-2-carboxylate isomerase